MTLSRRALLISSAAATAVVAVTPIALGGMESFLRRVLANHFGPEVLGIEGVDAFVGDYAQLAGSGDFAKRVGAEIYFAWRGELVHKIGAARDLEAVFLRSFLTRSNIIAIQQGRDVAFEYGEVDPWVPTCGLYLSALAEVENTMG